MLRDAGHFRTQEGFKGDGRSKKTVNRLVSIITYSTLSFYAYDHITNTYEKCVFFNIHAFNYVLYVLFCLI